MVNFTPENFNKFCENYSGFIKEYNKTKERVKALEENQERIMKFADGTYKKVKCLAEAVEKTGLIKLVESNEDKVVLEPVQEGEVTFSLESFKVLSENFNSLFESHKEVIETINKLLKTVKSIDEQQEKMRLYVIKTDEDFIKLQNHLVDIGVITPKVEGDKKNEE